MHDFEDIGMIILRAQKYKKKKMEAILKLSPFFFEILD